MCRFFTTACMLFATSALSATAQGVVAKRLSPINATEAQSFEKQPKIALLVGVSKYPAASGFESLQYAAQDVTDIRESLKRQNYEVSLLTDSDATRGAIVRTLRQVAESVEANHGTLLFYFSGHGYSVGNNAYLAPVSASKEDLEREGLAVSEVEKIMAGSKAQRKVMMLDACRAESKQKGAGGRSFSSLEAASGFRILNSTNVGDVSYESNDLNHGVFSAFILKGLNGEAAGGDGLVTFNDLAGYVTEAMRKWGIVHHVVQVPYERSAGGEVSGDFLLARAMSAAAPDLPHTSTKSPIMTKAEDLFAERRYAEALPFFQQAAVSDPRAMSSLGSIYRHGNGVTVDYQQAMAWFRKAADAGDVAGYGELGDMYSKGQGVAQDYQQAMIWYKKAADAGDVDAIGQVGSLYHRGLGTAKDYEQAMIWYKKAADAGNAEAMDNIGLLYQKGLGVPQSNEQALTWLRKAADAGSLPSMNRLGVLLGRGLGGPPDYQESMKWLLKASELGDLQSMNNVGWLYEHGQGVAQDYQQAMGWYRRAADARYSNAMVNMARLYDQGLGVKKNHDQAIDWLRKAAALNNNGAKENLKNLGLTP